MPNYLKLHAAIWDNPKFLSLPDEAARLAYIRVLTAAKASDPEGQWPSRPYLEAQLRGDPWVIPHLDAIFGADLLDLDASGRVTIRQWTFWQKWEGKRSADQLAAEAPAVLKKRQEADARRQRTRYWIEKFREGMVLFEDVPDDVRPAIIERFPNEFSAETSREAHDHIDRRTDGRMSSVSDGDSGGGSPKGSPPPPFHAKARESIEMDDKPF